jgi:hypothetical protein
MHMYVPRVWEGDGNLCLVGVLPHHRDSLKGSDTYWPEVAGGGVDNRRIYVAHCE